MYLPPSSYSEVEVDTSQSFERGFPSVAESHASSIPTASSVQLPPGWKAGSLSDPLPTEGVWLPREASQGYAQRARYHENEDGEDDHEDAYFAPSSGMALGGDSTGYSSIAGTAPDAPRGTLLEASSSDTYATQPHGVDANQQSSGIFMGDPDATKPTASAATITASQMTATSFGSFQQASTRSETNLDLSSTGSCVSLSEHMGYEGSPEAGAHLGLDDLPPIEPPAQYVFAHPSQERIQFAHYHRFASPQAQEEAQSGTMEVREVAVFEFQRRVNMTFDSSNVRWAAVSNSLY